MNESMLHRDPDAASQREHAVIVIGGGIHGAAVALEAARRGLRPLLLERHDFGSATTFNSLRILHGGLRYLQSFDLRRHRASVAERHWFMQHFPDLVRPLACLMPLYGSGLRRPSVMKTALQLNDILSVDRNQQIVASLHLPSGELLTPEATIARFTAVDRRGLRGGALWYDAVMPSSERVLMEMLRWACAAGATVLNYAEVIDLVTNDGRVAGVQAVDTVTGGTFTFNAPAVVNCAGPWCGEVAAALHRSPSTLAPPAMAFNLLIDRRPLSDAALAVAPRTPAARTYFLVPWHGSILAGTYHAPHVGDETIANPTLDQMQMFINDLNAAIPALHASLDDVRVVCAGLLPAKAPGSATPTSQPRIIDHATIGGPRGLITVAGVKFTTARRVAEQALTRLYGRQHRRLPPYRSLHRPEIGLRASWTDCVTSVDDPCSVALLNQIAREEAVVHLDDLILRRGYWHGTASQAMELGRHIAPLLQWEASRCEVELARLQHALRPFSTPVAADLEVDR